MIVFDLACDAGHGFEGWFASTDAYEQQRARGLLECPLCGIKSVTRRLSAPRLNLGAPMPSREKEGRQQVATPSTDVAADNDARLEAAKTAFYQHLSQQLAAMASDGQTTVARVREMLERSEDVGDRFPEEARRIHYNEVPERQIHGCATRDETIELLDEGIAVLPMPFGIKRNDELN